MSEVVSNKTGETVLEPLYDDNGILTQKTDYEGTTYYTNIDGNFTTQYLESKTGIPTEQMQFIYDDNNQVTALCFNTAMYYYVKNAMGDVIGIVNEDGKRVCTYEYDAWGNVLNTYHYDSTGIDYNVGERNPIRYRSYYFDNSIGFYYLQSRFYFASMARFINADLPEIATVSKDDVNGQNLFAYCNNDPVNYVDPSGYSKLSNLVDKSSNLASLVSGIASAIVTLAIFVAKKATFWNYVSKIATCIATIATACSFISAMKKVKSQYSKSSRKYKTLKNYNVILLSINIIVLIVGEILGGKVLRSNREIATKLILATIGVRIITVFGVAINLVNIIAKSSLASYRTK